MKNWKELSTQLKTISMALFCSLAVSKHSYACNEMPMINPYEAKVRNVEFVKGVTQKWCLKPSAQKSGMIEFQTVNRSNAQCGVLKMVVHLPNGEKLKSEGSQPGSVAQYAVGKYVMSFTMKSNEPKCKTWDLGVRLPY